MKRDYLRELYFKTRRIRRRANAALRQLRRTKRTVQPIPRETDEEIRAALAHDLGTPAFD